MASQDAIRLGTPSYHSLKKQPSRRKKVQRTGKKTRHARLVLLQGPQKSQTGVRGSSVYVFLSLVE